MAIHQEDTRPLGTQANVQFASQNKSQEQAPSQTHGKVFPPPDSCSAYYTNSVDPCQPKQTLPGDPSAGSGSYSGGSSNQPPKFPTLPPDEVRP